MTYPRLILALSVTGALCACNPMTSPDAKPEPATNAALSPSFARKFVPPKHVVLGIGQVYAKWGSIGPARQFLEFAATMDADGDVSGKFRGYFENPRMRIEMDIKCFDVVGTDAWIRGVVTESSDLSHASIGSAFAFRVRSVTPGFRPPPDATSDFFSVANPTLCSDHFDATVINWRVGNIAMK